MINLFCNNFVEIVSCFLFIKSPLFLLYGMMAGAAIAHNFGLAGSADSVSEAGEYIVGGIKTNGQIAAIIALVILLVISLVHLPKKEK